MNMKSNIICPHCKSILVGRIDGRNRYFCRDCYNEFELGQKHVDVFNVLKDGRLSLLYRDNTSRNKYNLRGVSYVDKRNVWEARLYHDKGGYYIGQFTTPKEAAIAYNNKVLEIIGEAGKYKMIDLSIFDE